MDNDFGFTTVSAEDYAKAMQPVAPAPAPVPTTVDMKPMLSRIDALITMVEALDDKIDTADNKVDAIGEKLGVVEMVLKSDSGEDLVPKAKLVKMAELILPLLRNLRDTAKDEFIRWPNRGPVIQAQINSIEALLQ